jgi:hypothetical protein
MGKKRALIVAGLVAAGLILAVPFAASGGKHGRIVLSERNELTGPTTQAGTFTSAGAVNDAGSATATFSVVPHGPGRGLLTGTHVFTGSAGTITVETRAVVAPFPPPNPPRSYAIGKWRVVGGTGAYAGLKGGGHIAATADFGNGQITIVRVGKVNR